MKLLLGLSLVFLLAGCGSSQVAEQNAKVAEINTKLGLTYLQEDRFELAKIKLQKALEAAPNSSQVNWAMALLHDKMGNDGGAERFYRKAIAANKQDAEALNNFATFLCKRERYDEALTIFAKAIKNPGYVNKPIAYTNAGVCLVRAEDRVKAERYFREALDIDTDYSPALYQMALLMQTQKRYLAARAYRQRLEGALNREDPKLLLLCAKTERGLGNNRLADECTTELESKFPASKEASSIHH